MAVVQFCRLVSQMRGALGLYPGVPRYTSSYGRQEPETGITYMF